MKKDRHARIIQIIESRDIETQEELADELRRSGYNVTQATVSRDIRALGLTKVQTGQGHQKYVVLRSEDGHMTDKYIRVLREAYVSMVRAQNIIVLHTVSGMAMACAVALDELQLPGLAGCIAGDDTIFAAVRTGEETERVMEQLAEMVK
ncbi:arginine repressor [Lachnoclostridium sp. Marseille-P6806]|uniref:arginine repressor n=1 Tax=Lachnoclostridium sp. Marseille-P6806 TaxID=2364793 RepID=UPI0010323F8D|nr:arginine repressor [Lachnoclostridium sp. Marseille-P6806]